MNAKTILSLCRLGWQYGNRAPKSPKAKCFLRQLHSGKSLNTSNVSPAMAAVQAASISKTYPTSHRSLSIGFDDKLAADFQYIWLRDNCHCYKCIHPKSKQKLLDTVSLDINIKPKSFKIAENGNLQIVWPESDGEEHVSFYDPNWLHKYGKAFELDYDINNQLPPMTLWNREMILQIKPEMFYEEFMASDEGVKKWLAMIYKYGVAVMKGVPCKQDEVINVVEHFAYVKKTKWGQSFDVLCEPVQSDPNHLAYTGMFLEHHTDMNYLEKSPGLQALHCLKASDSSPTGSIPGGQSFFVDGFYVAKWLQKHHPSSFHALSSTSVKFSIYSHNMEYSNLQNVICANKTGDIQEIHYNTRTLAPLEAPPDAIRGFYEAYKLFGQKMREPESEFAFNLVPGDLVAFNNRRILHGRTRFDPTKISRHLQGCYGDLDEVITRYKTNIKDQVSST